MKNVKIFDNEGATADRYTIVNTKTGDLLGCNSAPFHPQGIGQYCGNLVDNIMFHKYGASWRKHCAVKKIEKVEIANYINEAKSNPKWLGIEVEYKALNKDIQQFIKQSFE